MDKMYQLVLNRTNGTKFASESIYVNREYALDIANRLNLEGQDAKDGTGFWVVVDREVINY